MLQGCSAANLQIIVPTSNHQPALQILDTGLQPSSCQNSCQWTTCHFHSVSVRNEHCIQTLNNNSGIELVWGALPWNQKGAEGKLPCHLPQAAQGTRVSPCGHHQLWLPEIFLPGSTFHHGHCCEDCTAVSFSWGCRQHSTCNLSLHKKKKQVSYQPPLYHESAKHNARHRGPRTNRSNKNRTESANVCPL